MSVRTEPRQIIKRRTVQFFSVALMVALIAWAGVNHFRAADSQTATNIHVTDVHPVAVDGCAGHCLAMGVGLSRSTLLQRL